jgi:hypothetical protein
MLKREVPLLYAGCQAAHPRWVPVTSLREISPPGTLWVPGLASLGCINL